MSQSEPQSILQQIDDRLSALGAAQKQLKKPSTISFVERRDLTSKAAKAADELRERRAEVEGTDAASGTETPENVRAALEAADRVLGQIGGPQAGGFDRRPAGAARNLGGQSRRGGGGMSSQTRPPDRIGGE